MHLRTTLCLWATIVLLASSTVAAERPNIVIIYGDDVGYGDVGCYGATTIPTPNIDRLAERGLRFTSGYCTSATCTPSRFSLMTGVYAWRVPGTGIAPPNAPALIEPGTTTLASVLYDAGYRTGIVGKWHLGLGNPPKPDWAGEIKPGPLEVGFESSFILPTTNDRVPCVYVDGHQIVNGDPSDPVDVFTKNPDGQPTGETARSGLKLDWSKGHNQSIVNGIGRIGFMVGGDQARWTDETMAEVFTGKAQEFIANPDDRPFFLFYSAHQIHVPRAPNEKFVGKTPHGARGDAMVELDWCVGEVIAALESRGDLDNTLILVSSDNGPVLDDGYKDGAVEKLGAHQPAGPFRGGKYRRTEGGTRVPWIVHWPARVEPGTSDALMSQVDWLATFAAIADTPVPNDSKIDSRDYSEALVGESHEGREYVVEHASSNQPLAIRRGNWKYLAPLNRRGSEAELYDLASDPGERKNLAAARPELVKELTALLEQVQAAN